MQIQNVNSPNFSGVKINTSKMNPRQNAICNSLVNSLTYSDTFLKAHEELLDVYLLPGRRGTVNVAIMDKISDMFVKDFNKRLNLNVTQSDNITNCSEIILSNLKNIMNKNIARPKYNHDKILLGKTDFARLRPQNQAKMNEATRGIVDIEVIKDVNDSSRKLINEF